ncbi:MAG: 4Fe-4S binding protein [Clostridia bacterium]|nr:4Fe-4S binding protein [Clostridia bacterium]
MAFKITDDCDACGICEMDCPMGAIEEGDDIYVINQDECDECGTCVHSCPNGAIIEE